jgi:hypothetical protein
VKNPRKQMTNVFAADEAVNILLNTAKPVNIKNESPPKQAVMMRVCLKVILVSGVGLRKENGHQIKSRSESQL